MKKDTLRLSVGLVLSTLIFMISSCSADFDAAYYYELTRPLTSLDPQIAGDTPQKRDYPQGELVIVLKTQKSEDSTRGGSVLVVTDRYHDIGWVQKADIQRTTMKVPYPESRIYPNNDSEVIFARNNNSSRDSTYLNEYRLVAILPVMSRSAEIVYGSSTIYSIAFASDNGYKVIDTTIPLVGFETGQNKLLVSAFGKDKQLIGSRELVLGWESTTSRDIRNSEIESFSYTQSADKIEIDRFFGFSNDDEDTENYKPDFNRYLIDGFDKYSFSVQVQTNPEYTRRWQLPLEFSILQNGVIVAKYPLRQFELTPQSGEKATIVDLGKHIILSCLPAFEAAPRTVIFDKETSRVYDTWQLLTENGITDYNPFLAVTIGEYLILEEKKTRFYYSERALRTYVVSLQNGKLIETKQND